MSVFTRRWTSHLPLVATLVVGTTLAIAGDYSDGRIFSYTGYLEHNGTPLSEARAMRFALYTTDVGGTACQTLAFPSVDLDSGAFSVVLEDVDDSCVETGVLYTEIGVADENDTNYVVLGERVRITSAPFAAAVGGLDGEAELVMGTNEIKFTDPQNPISSTAKVVLSADDESFGEAGLTLRTLQNPNSGDAIFRVLSSGGAERLRVEHDGEVYTDDDFHAAGDVLADLDVDATGTVHGGNIETDGAYQLTSTGQTRDVLVASWANANGLDVELGAGGNTIVGGGEAAAFVGVNVAVDGQEDLLLASDDDIHFYRVVNNNTADPLATLDENGLAMADHSDGCPSDMDRIGSDCIDMTWTQPNNNRDTHGEVVEYCHDRGKNLCNLEQIIRCDSLNVRNSTNGSCGDATDGYENDDPILNYAIRTSTMDYDNATLNAADNVFDRHVAYYPADIGGINADNRIGIFGGNGDLPFFCCQPANPLLLR